MAWAALTSFSADSGGAPPWVPAERSSFFFWSGAHHSFESNDAEMGFENRGVMHLCRAPKILYWLICHYWTHIIAKHFCGFFFFTFWSNRAGDKPMISILLIFDNVIINMNICEIGENIQWFNAWSIILFHLLGTFSCLRAAKFVLRCNKSQVWCI